MDGPTPAPWARSAQPTATQGGTTAAARKLIRTKQDLPMWQRSAAYQDLLGFLGALNASVANKTISDECFVSPTVQTLVDVLNIMAASCIVFFVCKNVISG